MKIDLERSRNFWGFLREDRGSEEERSVFVEASTLPEIDERWLTAGGDREGEFLRECPRLRNSKKERGV